MSNQLDPFDELIKGQLQDYEVPFEAGAWESMSQKLDQVQPATATKGISLGTKLAAVAAIALVATTAIYFALAKETTPKVEVVEQTHKKQNHGETPFKTAIETPVSSTLKTNESQTDNVDATKTVNPTNGLDYDVQESSTSSPVEDPQTGAAVTSTPHLEPDKADKNVTEQTPDEVLPDVPETETIPSALPPLHFTANTSEVCVNGSIHFELENEIEEELVWFFGDGTFSSEKHPVHQFKKAGEFEVTVSRKDAPEQEERTGLTVRVNPNPEIKFSWQLSEQNAVPPVEFSNRTSHADQWLWTFGDGEKSTEDDPNHIYQQRGNYEVTLAATNDYGCSSSKTQTVQVQHLYNLFAPSAFTPNGDNRNDTWIPVALEVLDVPFTLTIFDRSGTPVYETQDVNRPWDGQDYNGNVVEGSYVWVLDIKEPSGSEDRYSNTVLLRAN